MKNEWIFFDQKKIYNTINFMINPLYTIFYFHKSSLSPNRVGPSLCPSLITFMVGPLDLKIGRKTPVKVRYNLSSVTTL